MTILEAKQALDKIISKGRVHLYKPIQIAEILYRDRIEGDINLSDLVLETLIHKERFYPIWILIETLRKDGAM